MAEYIAKERGFAGRLIEAGEEFEWGGKPGSWMEPVGGDKPKRAKPDDGAKGSTGGNKPDGNQGGGEGDKPKTADPGKGSPSNQDVI